MTTTVLKFKYQDVVQDTNGAIKIGATVTVYLTGTTTPADLYEDDSVTSKTNPVKTDSEGEFSFTILPGTYDLKIVYGDTTKTYSKVVINGGLKVTISTDDASGTPSDGDTWWKYVP
jgi:hypothetical protein